MDDYYKKRVLEYENIYNRNDPTRLAEQQKIAEKIREFLKNREVIEIAAGTGYWTQFLSETASKIVVSDYLNETLELAKTKKYNCPVEFKKEDAYNLSFPDNSFSGGMANFWLSHVSKKRIFEFFKEFHRVLKDKSAVFIADNNFDELVGGKLVELKKEPDTYKIRKLDDGTTHKILKNYFSKKELFDIFNEFSGEFSDKNIFYGKKFWYVFYILDKSKVYY